MEDTLEKDCDQVTQINRLLEIQEGCSVVVKQLM